MKNRLFGLFCSLLLVGGLVSCGLLGSSSTASSEGEEKAYPVTVRDVSISRMPERVVSLSPALTEQVYELGFGSRLKACTDYCDYPDEAAALPHVGTALHLDVDTLLSVSPEYVIAQTALPKEVEEQLNQIGVGIVVFPVPTTLEGVAELYQEMTLFFEGNGQGEIEGKAYTEHFLADLNQIKMAITKRNEPLSAVYLVGVPGMAATGDTLEQEVMELLHLRNVAADSTGWKFGEEELRAADPDLFLVTEDVNENVYSAEGPYHDLRAVQSGKVFPVYQVVWERQSPRMIREIDTLARSIYGSDYHSPELFFH